MNNKKPSLTIILAATSLAPINAVMFSPSLPYLANFFHITRSDTQLTIVIFLLGYALSQLFFGPPANAFGRRVSLFTGITIGIFGSLLCVLSGLFHQFWLMEVGRFITGFGTASGLTLAYTMINDIYENVKARQMVGYCTMSFAVSPGLANLLGGFIAQYCGWIGCFYFLLIFNILVMFLAFGLPETLSVKYRTPLKANNIVNGYLSASGNKTIIILGIVYGISTSILYGLIAFIPFIGIDHYKLPPSLFGLIFFLSYSGYLAGAILSTYTANKVKATHSLLTGVLISTSAGILLTILVTTNTVNIWSLFLCVFLILGSMPFIFTNASIIGIASHHDKANASSVFMFITVFMSFLTVYGSGFIYGNYLIIVAFGTFILSVISLSVFTIFIQVSKREESEIKSANLQLRNCREIN